MPTHGRSGALTLVARWVLGTALVSWRYMWETTPFHRDEYATGDAGDSQPDLPADACGQGLQVSDDGHGPLFHRRFRVRVTDADMTAERLMAAVLSDFKRFVPSEVVGVRASPPGGEQLRQGDELVVEMPGPWNGPVRVVHQDATCLRLATLPGHLEAGQVQFSARHDEDRLVFEVELWGRPSSRLVHLLYSHLRLAKEVQLNMWVRFCLAAANASGGRLADGVHIRTHRTPSRLRPAAPSSAHPGRRP